MFLDVPATLDPVSDTKGQAEAIRFVQREMHFRNWNAADLAREASIDAATVGDFLNGTRWPRTKTRSKIEKAIDAGPGTLQAMKDERDPSVIASLMANYVTDEGPTAEPALSDLDDSVLERKLMELLQEKLRRHGGA